MRFISFLFDLIKTAASGIAIYLFLFKRDKIRSLFSLLMNYAFQTTLTELRAKLDDINSLRVDDDKGREEIINLFADIKGQIRVNKVLSGKCAEICNKLSLFVKNPEVLTEPEKRTVVSELRETLKVVDIESYDDMFRR